MYSAFLSSGEFETDLLSECCVCLSLQASSPHSQHSTVDVSQLHDPHSYSQHSIQVQHIQVAEPTGTVHANAQVSSWLLQDMHAV